MQLKTRQYCKKEGEGGPKILRRNDEPVEVRTGKQDHYSYSRLDVLNVKFPLPRDRDWLGSPSSFCLLFQMSSVSILNLKPPHFSLFPLSLDNGTARHVLRL